MRERVTRSASDSLRGLTFERGAGCRCWTVDGREFIDLTCGQGPVILGHAHPGVTAAVNEQMAMGTLLPGPIKVTERLRARLAELYPGADSMLTFKSGSEAVAAAIRVARAH